MTRKEIVERIGDGRTDLVFDLLERSGWRGALHEGPVRLLQWFICYLLGEYLPASVPKR